MLLIRVDSIGLTRISIRSSGQFAELLLVRYTSLPPLYVLDFRVGFKRKLLAVLA